MKSKFYYKEFEKRRFYLKLGYNLDKPKFNQEMWKMKQFYYYNKKKLFILKMKLKLFLKTLLNKKFFIKDNKKFYDFLVGFTDIYKRIKLLNKDEVWEEIDMKMKLFYVDTSDERTKFLLKKFIKVVYSNLYLNLNKLMRKPKIKIFRKRRYNVKKKKIYKLILKNTNSNFFFILTTIKGRVVWYCTSGQVCEFYNIRRKKSHLLIKQMMNRFNRKLRSLRIKYLKIFIRSYISKHIKKVMIFLDSKRIKTKYIVFDKRFPHHFGQRRKKLRRI